MKEAMGYMLTMVVIPFYLERYIKLDMEGLRASNGKASHNEKSG
jgi:hypothetical protein